MYISMIAYFLFLLGVVEIMRRKIMFSHIFWICSLLTFPLWLMGGVVGWFRWAKILSVILPTIIVGFSRVSHYLEKKGPIWNKFSGKWIFYFFYCILFLNIAEATLKDVTLGNYFNAGAGLILCITIPLPLKYWTIPKEKYGDLITYTSLGWNFLYTTWNMCFVYGEGAQYFAASFCILMAAEIYPILKGKHELYLSARIYTLATHLIIRACFPNLFLNVMNSGAWFNPNTLNLWGIINLLIGLPYIIWYIIKMKKGTYASKLRQLYNT